MENKLNIITQDINISHLPVQSKYKNGVFTIIASVGEKVIFSDNAGNTETIFPCITIKYKIDIINNKVTVI